MKTKYRVWYNGGDTMEWHDCRTETAEEAADIVIENTGRDDAVFLVEEWRKDMPKYPEFDEGGVL
jgi:hypothetical protein